MATIRDIARHASVSTATVSRVLNQYPHVNETTRSAVRQAMVELGYPLSNARREPTANRTVLLGSRGPDDGSVSRQHDSTIGTEFARHIFAGAQQQLAHYGINAVLQTSGAAQNQRPVDPVVVGQIVIGGKLTREQAHELQLERIPFVIAGGCLQDPRVNCVMADYVQGVEQAVAHLVHGGRRTIGLINGPDTTITSYEKYRGLRLALALHDLAFSPAQVLTGLFTPEVGYALTLRLLEQVPGIDAILYGDDYLAMGGIHALKESGRRVPDDVAVIGLHEYEIGRFADPPLTSVAFDMRGMGAIAAQRLLMLIDQPAAPTALPGQPDEQPWFVSMPTTLAIRKSA